MSNYDDWDDILNQEDNPYDNPDTTFDCEDSAYEAGIILALENENGSSIDIDTEICFPSLAGSEIKKAFKAGYRKGADIRNERDFGDGEQEDMNINTLVYCPDDDEDELDDVEEEDDDEDEELDERDN
jgi:hypothetical protein